MQKLTGIPLFPLNTVLFPGMVLPLHIFEERYKLMVGRCIQDNLPFGIVLIRNGTEVGGGAEPFEVGTLARISDVQTVEDGRYRLNAVGTQRFRIAALHHDQPYLTGDVEIIDMDPPSGATPSMAERQAAEHVTALFGEYFRLSLTLARQWQDTISLPDDPTALADFVAARLVAPAELKQRMLEAPTTRARLDLEEAILAEAIPMLTESVRLRHQRRWGSPSSLN